MFVFRNTYTGRKGKKREASKWYCDFTSASGTRCRVPGFSDKKATEALGRQIERLVACRASGEGLPLDVQRWLEGLPAQIRAALNKFGLLDGQRLAAGWALRKQVEEWQACLIARGDTETYARKSRARVESVLQACGFVFLSDVSAARAMAYLHERKGGIEGIGPSTVNHYLRALKGFPGWLCRDGRTSSNPVAYLKAVETGADRRRVRRPLSVQEISLLLDGTANEPERHGMTGLRRSLLGRLPDFAATDSKTRRAEATA